MLMPICSGVRGTPALWIQKQSRVAGAVVFGLLVVVEYTTVLRCLFSQLCNGFHMRMRYDYALSCRSDRMFCITITVINGLVCALCRLTHRPLHSAEQSLVRCPPCRCGSAKRGRRRRRARWRVAGPSLN
uniref:Uncharacterized protein n=1 Tax=Aegilops tauschii subsp. strangulata TaxID=200361 RepID=A0A453GSX8_AEGTS